VIPGRYVKLAPLLLAAGWPDPIQSGEISAAEGVHSIAARTIALLSAGCRFAQRKRVKSRS